jgi:hypothetical protein
LAVNFFENNCSSITFTGGDKRGQLRLHAYKYAKVSLKNYFPRTFFKSWGFFYYQSHKGETIYSSVKFRLTLLLYRSPFASFELTSRNPDSLKQFWFGLLDCSDLLKITIYTCLVKEIFSPNLKKRFIKNLNTFNC